jgi:hypothetical protein
MANAYQSIRELARQMGGKAHSSRGFFAVPCPAHDDAQPSASIWLSNGRVRARCFAGCSEHAILAAISRQAGMVTLDGSFIAAPAQTLEPSAEDIEAEIVEARRSVELLARVEQIWSMAKPVAEGSPVARYLRETRGLDPRHIPAAIRFCPSLPHGWSRSSWPAMLGQVVDVEGALLGLHRTWLDGVTATKAPVEPNRAALGSIKGGAVRLWSAADSTDLLVGEGIETVLAAAQLAGWRYPAWAALSTSGLMALGVPRRFKRVTIMADHDPSGAGEHAARILAHRLRKRGLRVVVRVPPVVGQDFNDVLLAQRDAPKKVA